MNIIVINNNLEKSKLLKGKRVVALILISPPNHLSRWTHTNLSLRFLQKEIDFAKHHRFESMSKLRY